MGDKEHLSARVEADTKTRFRVAAAQRDMDMAELLREVVEDYLDELEEQEGNPKTKISAD